MLQIGAISSTHSNHLGTHAHRFVVLRQDANSKTKKYIRLCHSHLRPILAPRSGIAFVPE